MIGVDSLYFDDNVILAILSRISSTDHEQLNGIATLPRDFDYYCMYSLLYHANYQVVRYIYDL